MAQLYISYSVPLCFNPSGLDEKILEVKVELDIKQNVFYLSYLSVTFLVTGQGRDSCICYDIASSWPAAYLPVTQWKSCLSMSSSSPDAPIRNILLSSQSSPSSSLIMINQVVASLAVLNTNSSHIFLFFLFQRASDLITQNFSCF